MFVNGFFTLVSTTSKNPDIQSRVGEKGRLYANEGENMIFTLADGVKISSSIIKNVAVKGGGLYVSVLTKSGTAYSFSIVNS